MASEWDLNKIHSSHKIDLVRGLEAVRIYGKEWPEKWHRFAKQRKNIKLADNTQSFPAGPHAATLAGVEWDSLIDWGAHPRTKDQLCSAILLHQGCTSFCLFTPNSLIFCCHLIISSDNLTSRIACSDNTCIDLIWSCMAKYAGRVFLWKSKWLMGGKVDA